MATPALARFGSDELKKQFLVPTIAGDVVACIGVSEVGSGSDVSSIKTTAVPKKGIMSWFSLNRLLSKIDMPLVLPLSVIVIHHKWTRWTNVLIKI